MFNYVRMIPQPLPLIRVAPTAFFFYFFFLYSSTSSFYFLHTSLVCLFFLILSIARLSPRCLTHSNLLALIKGRIPVQREGNGWIGCVWYFITYQGWRKGSWLETDQIEVERKIIDPRS